MVCISFFVLRFEVARVGTVYLAKRVIVFVLWLTALVYYSALEVVVADLKMKWILKVSAL
jgi:hypothetical protein